MNTEHMLPFYKKLYEEKHRALPLSSQVTKITLSRVSDSPSVKRFSSLEDNVRAMCYKSHRLQAIGTVTYSGAVP